MDKAHQKETSASFPESELKLICVDDRINFCDSLSENSDYMWPSSDSLSSSLQSSDGSQDVLDCDCYRLSLQDQFSLSLSTVSSVFAFEDYGEYSFRDLSKTSPESEMSSRQMFSAGNVLGGLQSGIDGNKVKNQVVHSESSNQCQIADASISKILFALPSENMDTPSCVLESSLETWVSSLDLDREDSELIRTGEKDSVIFDSDFPSPSFSTFSAVTHHQVCSSSSRSLTYDGKEDKNRTTTDSDEPLVWPFDRSLYCRLDFEKFFCPSPCKVETNIFSTGLAESKLTGLPFHHNCPPVHRKNIQGFGRRNAFNLTPKSFVTKSETKDVGSGAQKPTLVQSKLNRSTKAPSRTSKRRGKPQLKIDVQKHACSSNELNRQMKELESHLSFLIRDSIENVIGLSEFHGHEGISADLVEEFAFYFSPSPCKALMPTKSLESTEGQWLP